MQFCFLSYQNTRNLSRFCRMISYTYILRRSYHVIYQVLHSKLQSLLPLSKSYDKFGDQCWKRNISHAHFNGDLVSSRAGLDFVTMRPFLPVSRIEPKSTISWLAALSNKQEVSCSGEWHLRKVVSIYASVFGNAFTDVENSVWKSLSLEVKRSAADKEIYGNRKFITAFTTVCYLLSFSFFFLHPQNGAYLHRDFQAHTSPVADSAGLCSRKKSYSRFKIYIKLLHCWPTRNNRLHTPATKKANVKMYEISLSI